MVYALYNPLAGNGTCEEKCKLVEKIFDDSEVKYINLLTVEDIRSFINNLGVHDRVVICGGDGTLNFLINNTNIDRLEQDVFYFPAGSGNDFYHDIDEDKLNGVYQINKYLKGLPTVEVNGMKKLFLNGIGFGIDGYCCEEGDKERVRKPGERVNYTKVALKGLAYDYKPVNARVTVDGDTKEFHNVWMVPSMNGRYYGGGMMCAPNQRRLDEDGKVSVIVISSKFRLRLLMIFPSLFAGKHLKHKDVVTEIKGSFITVEFDRPTALQIDGETVTGVTKYSVRKEIDG